jgi:hypothetical protein
MRKYNLFVNGKKKNYDIKKACEELDRWEKIMKEMYSSRRLQEKIKRECRKVHTIPLELLFQPNTI